MHNRSELAKASVISNEQAGVCVDREGEDDVRGMWFERRVNLA